MNQTPPKLGLIAGGGPLPLQVASACRASGRGVFVVRIKGMADPADFDAYDGADAGIAELGKAIDLLKTAGCGSICFAGVVKRPDFNALKPDLRGLKALPGVIASARKGDDALLRFLVGEFEREGFQVEGAQAIAQHLPLDAGALGAVSPGAEHQADIRKALEMARWVGEHDIGQAAVVAAGVVLALEAQEGTDAMLRRCAALPEAVRGHAGARVGVLAKAPKPIQERRIDLPVIGIDTVERAADAGLAGIVGEAGAVLVLDREGVIATADRLGLFVWGVRGA